MHELPLPEDLEMTDVLLFVFVYCHNCFLRFWATDACFLTHTLCTCIFFNPTLVLLLLFLHSLEQSTLILSFTVSNYFAATDIKPDVPLAVEPLSPLDLRTDLRMLGPGSDHGLWERQLQQELLLIQKQQQIQKQLLISEFQKQHEKLTRQHQAQLQEHLKVSFSLNSCIIVCAAQKDRLQHSMALCGYSN